MQEIIQKVKAKRREKYKSIKWSKKKVAQILKGDQLQYNYQKPLKLFFMDEMRFGLISNYRRSWSKVGKRTVIANQQEYSNRYLYSAIDPIKGEHFHLIGFNHINSLTTKLFLEELKKRYSNYHLIVIWDKAPFHRKKELYEIEDISPYFLPAYSPELNPVERFFGEIRKATANRIFKDIDIQEKIIEKEVVLWMNDKERTKKLCGYSWILEQCKMLDV